MRDQYDFTGGVRGKYVVVDQRIAKNVIAIVNGLQVMVRMFNDGSTAMRKFLVEHKRLKGGMRYRRAYDRRAALIAKGGGRRRANRRVRN